MAFTQFYALIARESVSNVFINLYKLPNAGNLEHAITFTSAMRISPVLQAVAIPFITQL